MDLKQFLEYKRLQGKRSQSVIAKQLGIDQTTVSLYENNPRRLLKKGANFVERFFSAYQLSNDEKNNCFRDLYQDLTPHLDIKQDKAASLDRIANLLEELSEEIRSYQGR